MKIIKIVFGISLKVLILSIVSSTYVTSQQKPENEIDSVFTYINKIYRTDSEKALSMLDSLKNPVFNNGSNKQRYSFHLNYFKVIYFAKGDNQKSLYHLHNAKKYAGTIKDLALVYNKLGQYHHRSSSMLDSSMFYQIKAIETLKKQTDTYSLTHYYLDLGNLYITLGDLPQAAEFMNKSLEISRKGGKRKDYGYSLINAIDVYEQLKDTINLALLHKEYSDLKSVKSDQSSTSHQNTSFISDPLQKKAYLKSSIKTNQKNKDLTMLRTNRLLMADQLINEKDYMQAINLLEDGLTDIQDSILLTRHNYYIRLKKLNESIGNYKKALMYADLTNTVEKDMMDEKRISAIREMEAKYNKLEQDNQIFILQKEKDVSKRNMYLALLGTGLISTLALGFFVLYKQKSKNIAILNQKNEQITTVLHEKDMLLREIHHRVKNNLQVVSSLLNLQSNYVTDEIALEAINEGKNRVLSMALIHQNLYTDEHLTAIETKGYFENLLDQLFESYNIDEEHIKLYKDIDNLVIDVDTMIPLGLITNELISNSLKHAFTDRNEGSIFFSLKDEGDKLCITIKDDGKGMDVEKFKASNSFGNKMIHAFIHKIKAAFEVNGSGRTEFVIRIDKKPGKIKAA